LSTGREWFLFRFENPEKRNEETKKNRSVITTKVKDEGQIDQHPDPAALNAKIERLKKLEEEAKKMVWCWRKQQAEARAGFAKGKGVVISRENLLEIVDAVVKLYVSFGEVDSNLDVLRDQLRAEFPLYSEKENGGKKETLLDVPRKFKKKGKK
jgi:hypothetical protein